MSPDSIPEPVARIAAVMDGFAHKWFLCGGWAVDAWLGLTTREHHDVDLAAFHDDQAAIFAQVAARTPIGHDDNVAGDTQEPWEGRWLDMPAHVHLREADGLDWEFQLCERDGPELVLRREPRTTLPLAEAWGLTGWGIPALTPPVIVYYKAIPPTWRDEPRDPPRPHDIHDFEVLLPLLRPDARAWLARSIADVEPDHPWLPALRP